MQLKVFLTALKLFSAASFHHFGFSIPTTTTILQTTNTRNSTAYYGAVYTSMTEN